MARQSEIVAVYSAGLVQGVALVTFPAASSILTSPDYYGLTSTAYGGLFLPQAIAAISAALAGSRLTTQLGVKRMFVAGLVGDLAAMSLLVASQFFIGDGVLPVRDAPAGDDQPGHRLRADGAGDQYVRRGVLSSDSGPRGPLPERVAWPRDGAGACPGGGLPRDRPVVGAAGRRRRASRGADRLQPGPAAARRGLDRRRGRAASAQPCHRGSGSSPRSPCSMESSRRRTATGQRCT